MSIKEKLESELNKASWGELKPHFHRDALIIVAPHESLVTVGVAFHDDKKEQVEKWLGDGTISKCSPDLANQYDEQETPANFEYLILQPFVLVKLIKPDFH